MLNSRFKVLLVTLCLVFGTIPFTVGAASSKAVPAVSISYLDVGGPNTAINDEYVAITNKGTTDVKMKGWVIKDKIKKHVYKFPSSYVLKAKKSVEIHTGKSTGPSGTHTKKYPKLYWGKGWYVWNNEGDTAYLYNAQGKLVSSKTVKT